MSRRPARVPTLLLALVLLLGAAAPAAALTPQEKLVEEARLTALSLLADPQLPDLPAYATAARAIIIMPELVRGGFFFGAEGGTGVLLVHQPGGTWSDPVFLTMVAGSFGLQFGGQIAEMVLTIMTDAGLNAVLDRNVTLGADLSAAIASVGSGLEARTGIGLDADMYAFSRTEGLFIGGSVEGSVIAESSDWNRAYYGSGASARAIVGGQYTNPHSETLRMVLPR